MTPLKIAIEANGLAQKLNAALSQGDALADSARVLDHLCNTSACLVDSLRVIADAAAAKYEATDAAVWDMLAAETREVAHHLNSAARHLKEYVLPVANSTAR